MGGTRGLNNTLDRGNSADSKEKASYVAGPSWDVYPFSWEEF